MPGGSSPDPRKRARSLANLKRGDTVIPHTAHRRDWFSPAEVFASQRAGTVVGLRGWRDRLFLEAGFLRPVTIERPAVPPGASEELRRGADGFTLLAGLRALRDPGEPSPLTRSFAGAWCGVPEWAARESIFELRQLGVIRKVGETAAGKQRPSLFGVVTAGAGNRPASCVQRSTNRRRRRGARRSNRRAARAGGRW
jgi:hypothetical protein